MTVLIGVAVAVAVVAAQVDGPVWLVAGAVIAVLLLSMPVSLRDNVTAYAASLSLQIPHSIGLLRVAVSDLFFLPAFGKTVYDMARKRERWPASILAAPLGVILIAIALSIVVGYTASGQLPTYVWLNRGIGIVFLICAYFVLIRFATNVALVHMVARWFILGVSVSTLAAFVMAGITATGITTTVFIPTTLRLNGWVSNPTLFGGLLMTAALIEMGLLTAPPTAGESRRWRWINLASLGLALAATVSRSSWLSAAFGATVMLGIRLWEHYRNRTRPGGVEWMIGAWALAPVVALGVIVAVNLSAGIESQHSRVEELHRLAEQEQVRLRREEELKRMPAKPVTATPSAAAEAPSPSKWPGDNRPLNRTAADDIATAFSPGGSVMNVRGVLDRQAIQVVAWNLYTKNVRTVLLGIGMGTFMNESPKYLGFPLIIHSTFVWFLVELGPLGFAGLVWLCWRTGVSLWRVSQSDAASRALGFGTLGAFAAMTVYWATNEGFYQRHFWIVLFVADRLWTLSRGRVGTPEKS
jgi:hypothetical protein